MKDSIEKEVCEIKRFNKNLILKISPIRMVEINFEIFFETSNHFKLSDLQNFIYPEYFLLTNFC